jgi:2-polyprenyl-6-methoxyphenol hydroxylase-like FAD-dependent oxidoreductase
MSSTEKQQLASPRLLRILISGAGIAGPVHAFWLKKLGADVTIVERAERIRKEGQTIDVRNEGKSVFEAMNIMEGVRAVTTKEEGIKFVGSNGRVWGSFPQSGADSFTSEIEIVRGELAGILYKETEKKDVKYVFGDWITDINQDDGNGNDPSYVEVTFGKDGRKERFDMLVIADGLNSRTRALAFKQDVRAPIHSLSEWYAGFSFSRGEDDSEWAVWYNAPGRRMILHRPDGFGRMRSGFCQIDYGTKIRVIGDLSKTTVAQQMEYWANLFKDGGWESERLIRGMMEADDFFMYEIAQVKMERWSTGRVVLIGDAASCPSPISGQGSNVAVVQAYTLAAMIAKHGADYKAAFAEYEATLRPWVKKVQTLPPGTPALAVPNTKTAILILNCFVWFGSVLTNSGIIDLFSRCFGGGRGNIFPLPSFSLFEGRSV